ncbi:FUSC family protein [Dermabacter vaginalis]|uniref:FUSC family protein n=1 Tax=Dermabacter TaxID=36739 RepID=UPI000F899085|nr:MULTISPECIES: FUSC family protein [Dermabacter]MCT2150305.1 FUSC family protein [Dermabacter vaginalis]RUP86670.1 FUSC family protein [Dermabacter sp. HSID17554]
MKSPKLNDWLHAGASRASDGAWQILLAAFTAAAAYWLSKHLWGHPAPFYSGITAFLIIGLTLETKIRKSIDMSTGVFTGIILGEIARLVIGSGTWQLFVTLFVSLMLARFIKASVIFSIQVGIQSMIVLLLPQTPTMTPQGRALDAITGISLGLLVHIAFSRDPRHEQRKAADKFFEELRNALTKLSEAALKGDSRLATKALTQIRSTSQRHTDAWALANDTANELTSYSPTLHRHHKHVNRVQHLLVGSDRAMRNARVIARREVEFLRVTQPHTFPNLAEALTAAVNAIDEIQAGVDTEADFTQARRKLRLFCAHLTPETLLATAEGNVGRLGHFEGISLVIQLRALAVDLLEATGLPSSDARRFLPSLIVVADSDIVGPRPITREMKAVEPPASTEALELLITDRTDPDRKRKP